MHRALFGSKQCAVLYAKNTDRMEKQMALKHVDSVHVPGVPRHQFLVTDNDGNYWIVSDAVAFADETMVFPANKDGEVTDWLEVGVAYPSGSHEDALNSAGLTLE